ncbi:methyl-accepting chemotaxis protein [Methylobacterium radiotolerans]
MFSLPLRVAVICSVLIAAVFAGGTTFLDRRINASFEEQTARMQSETLSSEAREVRFRLAVAARTAESLAAAASALRGGGIQDRAVYDAMLRELLRANPDLIATWTGWEPNALDGRDRAFAGTASSDASGRFMPYWNRGSGTIKREVLTGYEAEPDGAYYLRPKKLNRLVAIEPYIYPVAGKDVVMMSFGAPITVDGTYRGTAGVDIDLGSLNAALNAVKPFGTGYLAVISASGTTVAHPTGAAAGKPLHGFDASAADAAGQAIRAGAVVVTDAPGPDGAPWRYMAQHIQAGETPDRWAIVVAVPVATLTAAADQARATLIGISVLCVLIGCAVVFGALHRLVGRPIRALGRTIGDMAAGDYGADVPEARRRDEVGLVGRAVLQLRDGLRAQAQADARARADAQAAADRDRKRVTADLANAFEQAVGGIVETVTDAATELQATAKGLAATASETAGQSTTVAAGAEEAASNVRAAASAAEELGSSVQEIGRQVQGSAQLARAAADEAGRTVRLVEDLSAAVMKIGDVVALISGIAGQTNLLALNATHRGGPRRRGRPGLRGRGRRGEGAGHPDRAGHRRDRGADLSRSGLDRAGGLGDRQHHDAGRRDQRCGHDDRGRGRAAGRRDPGDRPQRDPGRRRHGRGDHEHRPRGRRRRHDRLGRRSGAGFVREPVASVRASAGRGQPLPRYGARGLRAPGPACALAGLPGDDEHPREGEQAPAVAARRVGPVDRARVGIQEAGAVLGIQRVEEGTQARGPDPVHDGGGIGHPVMIGGAPDIDLGGRRRQQIVVRRGLQHPPEAAGHGRVADRRRPGAGRRHRAHQAVGGLGEVVGHLHGQHAARGEEAEQPRQQGRVVRQPLQHGVGVDQVRRPLGCPGRGVGQREGEAGQPGAGALQHGRRGVEPDHLGVGETGRDQRGGVAGPAAEIDGQTRRFEGHAGEELGGGARPLVLEAGVEGGVPVGHRTLP